MPDLSSLRERVSSLLLSTPPQMKAFRARALALRAEGPAERPPLELFSVFIPEHLERAREVWEELFAAARSAPAEDGAAVLGAVVDRFESLRSEENPELVNYAMMVFISHHPQGRRYLSGTIPPLALRHPERVVPAMMSLAVTAEGEEPIRFAGISTVPEGLLDWYREDPLLNEHHEHWHVVYPYVGIALEPGEKPSVKDRQGELFIYMHQQMIARIDTERIAVGIGRLEPYWDFGTAIPPGYDPGTFLRDAGTFAYSARAANLLPKEVRLGTRQISPLSLRLTRDRLLAAVESGYFQVGSKRWRITPDLLGKTIEGGIGGVDGADFRNGYYANYHNNGHIEISLINDPVFRPTDPDFIPPGVMFSTATAARDPIFLRWHKEIDEIAFLWQERRKPHDLSDAPPVTLRKGLDADGRPWTPDIILCRTDDLPAEARGDLAAWGRRTFGGANWSLDFSRGTGTVPATDELLTRMHEGIIEYERDGRKIEIPYPYLNHDPFCYFLRVRNEMPVARKVTVRVWIGAEGYEEDRRLWVEMDKFVAELGPEEQAVIARSDLQSSVIRKPAVTDPGEYNRHYRPVETDLPDLQGYLADVDAARKQGSAELRRTLDQYLANFSAVLQSYIDRGFEPPEAIALRREAGRLRDEAEKVKDDPVKYAAALEAYHRGLLAFLTALAQFVYARTYCECGWPYSLLLPRGTREGMRFKLLVMLTDWELDRVGTESCCGSMSICGAVDRYPDSRPMGYPFDRPIPDGILETVAAQDNMACRTITVRWTDPR